MPQVRDSDVPYCPGASHGCGRKADPAIQGLDGKFRCVRCHGLHVELVDQESGLSAPNSAPAFVAAKKTDEQVEAFRAELRRQIANPKTFDEALRRMREQPHGQRDDIRELVRVRAEVRREQTRTRSILKKYGIGS